MMTARPHKLAGTRFVAGYSLVLTFVLRRVASAERLSTSSRATYQGCLLTNFLTRPDESRSLEIGIPPGRERGTLRALRHSGMATKCSDRQAFQRRKCL
ncbi:hypothetical protein HD554DRAFT_2104351, partial [Boletus coccyginus]